MASRALFSGYAGTAAHQARMDVLANNLANANTVAFKESRTAFRDAFYETLRAGTSASSGGGGQNAIQLGSGVSVAAVETVQTQGALESTSSPTDAAVNGAGFFIVSDGSRNYYTRDGGFFVDANNQLVMAATGLKVQGYMATNGVVDTQSGMTDIVVDVGSAVPAAATQMVHYSGNLDANAAMPAATQSVVYGGNLDSGAATGATQVAPMTVYDSLGDAHTITVTFTKLAAANQWTWAAADGMGDTAGPTTITFDGSGNLPAGTSGTLSMVIAGGATTPQPVTLAFDAVTQLTGTSTAAATSQDGLAPPTDPATRVTTVVVYDSLGLEHTVTVTFTKTVLPNEWTWQAADEIGNTAGPTTITFDSSGNLPAGTTGTLSMALTNGAASPQAVTLNLSAMTQMGGETTADAGSQDGCAAAVIQSVSIESNGIVTGNLSDGRTLDLAQIALAKFANPAGLDRSGENLYGLSDASGLAVVGLPNTGGRGDVQGQALEQSNVDMTKSFVDIIITQRGFQASTRVLAAANQLLQDVIQLVGQ